jgi:hypothetical protein
MISTKVYLSEETREALLELAEARGTSQSALIREALDDFLSSQNQEEDPLDESFGIWKDRENIHEEFREIRESMDRDVWARARDHHSDDDMTEDPDDA